MTAADLGRFAGRREPAEAAVWDPTSRSLLVYFVESSGASRDPERHEPAYEVVRESEAVTTRGCARQALPNTEVEVRIRINIAVTSAGSQPVKPGA